MSDEHLEEESQEEEEAAPVAVKPNGKAPKGKKGAGAPPVVGVAPSTPTKFQKQSNNADEVWNELVQWLPTASLSPYDISIQARRVWPPAPSGESTPVGRAFGGEMVQGGDTEPPGSALNQYIIRFIHCPNTQQPASYDVVFMRKSNGAQLATGRIGLPGYAECVNMLRAAEQQGLGGAPMQVQGPTQPYYAPSGPNPMPMPGYPSAPPPRQPTPQPAPPQAPPMNYPSLPLMPPGYGAPPPDVMHELAYLRGALGEALSAAREGRQPNIAPPAPSVGAGGLTDSDVDRIAARVAGIMGVLPKPQAPAAPPPTVAAPPPPVAPIDNSIEGLVRRHVSGMTERLITSALGSVEESIKRGVGIGAPPQPDDEEDPPPAQIVPPENPEDMMPWKVGDVGSHWGNGQPVKLAINKETGNIDFAGLAFANPVVAEKVLEMANGLGAALQDAIKKFTVGAPPAAPPGVGAAQVVREIPAGAVDANPNQSQISSEGGGWQAP